MKEVILAGRVPQSESSAGLNGQGGGLGSYVEFVEHLSVSEVSRTGEGVAVRVLIYNELERGSGGQVDGVAFLSGCGEWVGMLAERLGRTEELEEVWELVGGGSDKKAEVDATRSDDAEAAKSIDAKVGRIMETMSMAYSSLTAGRKV
ncbi:hypothetical protein HOY80DRAFT_1032350 [Tuber brumale]|nr:hypothetical protein HOY80DRAFT_1032350 [Tuber brumale]